MIMEDCPICQHPERESLEAQVLKGKLTKRDLAEIINCRVDEVYEHMTKHLVKRQLRDTDSKRNVLLSTLQKLNDNLDIIAQQKQGGPITTKQLVQLGAEIRKTIMDLNILEGNRPADQHITIEQYNDFRAVIIANITKMCPECQKILIEGIEEAEKTTEEIRKEIEERKKNDKPIIKVKSRT